MNEFASKSERTPSELELILERLTNKNEDWSRLTGDLQTGLQKISRYSEPETTTPYPGEALKATGLDETLIERLNEQLIIQEGYIQSLEFSLRHLRSIV